jgi:His-Xaa-Ser system radical SAM maturase HxsC
MNIKIKGRPKNIESVLVGKIKNKSEYSYINRKVFEYYDTNRKKKKYGILTTESINDTLPASQKKIPGIYSLKKTDQFESNDLIVINPNGLINNLFKAKYEHNSIFVTEMCNNNCIMCAQPPKYKNDIEELYSINQRLINLLPKHLPSLGITGGEPTLLGVKLYLLLEKIINALPETQIHILTNARAFAWLDYTRLISSLKKKNIIFGVPLYSDYYQIHDFISQIKDSFVQTLSGLYNLARFERRIEIRIILQRLTVERLTKISKFIYKNLPFVEHITFMGIEYFGSTCKNESIVWIDPKVLKSELAKTIDLLTINKMNVSIYNLPYCLLPEELWTYCKKSISEWKRGYLLQCRICQKYSKCGGIFLSSKKKLKNIKAIQINK